MGGLLAAFLLFAKNRIAIRFRTFLAPREYQGYYTTFHEYQYRLIGSDKNPEITHSEIRVFPSIKKKALLESRFGKYKYKGHMKILRNNIFFHLEGDGHDEQMLYIFKKPLLSEDFYIQVGLILCIAENEHPAATSLILSRVELPEDKVREILGTKEVCISKTLYRKKDWM